MRYLVLLLLSITAATAYALPTLADVEHAVHRNDYVAAESLTREVVAAEPNNAKPHYILAEILAHEGKVAEARGQAAQAKQIDPGIHFTSPDTFARFEAELNGNSATPRMPASAPHKAEAPGENGSSFLWVVLIVGGAIAFFAFRRRSASPGYGGYTNTHAPPPGQPGYPGATGYPPGYAPPGYPPGAGAGHSVAAGLGGLAAGMLAEHMIEGAMDRHHDGTGATFIPSGDNAPNSESVEDRPIDFGSSNDWGSGDTGGDAGGFDSGGGGDWS